MIKIGERVETCNFGWAEAITNSYEVDGKTSRGGWVDVKFDATGFIRKLVNGDFFKHGGIRDGSVEVVLQVGQVWNTNFDGKAKVVKVIDSRDCEIEFFNTGNKYKCQKDALLRGFVKDRPAIQSRIEKDRKDIDERVAERKRLMEFRASELARIRKAREERLVAMKQASQETWVRYQEALAKREQRNSELITEADIYRKVDNDLHKPSKGVLDIDFKDREGNWVLRFKHGSDFIQTRIGKLHNNVTQRSNEDGAYQNKFHKAYAGVTVSELFKNPQTFADWCVAQKGWGLGYQLDKDLLIDGNREYSEKACCFIPQEINIALHMRHKAVVSKKIGMYKALATMYGEKVDLGMYESEEEATEVCLDFKQRKMTKYASEFKGSISEAAYKRLTNT